MILSKYVILQSSLAWETCKTYMSLFADTSDTFQIDEREQASIER